jgi:hypothetical protein
VAAVTCCRICAPGAEACAAQLLLHDGGRGEALNALESLVDRADVVFCPID